MKIKLSLIQRYSHSALICFIALILSGHSAYCQQMQEMNSDSSSTKNQRMKNMDMPIDKQEEELAHPFYTHMGMPDDVGTYDLRITALSTQMDGKSKADFGFHFETGLSKFVGLHIRNNRFLFNPHTEIMFQFAAIRSKNGINGFSPIIEFEIPTHKGEKSINTLVGFSTTLSNSHIGFNMGIEYSPREDSFEGSAALVYKIIKRVYLVVELQGEKMPDETIALDFTAGVKVKLNKWMILGLGYQQPISGPRNFSSQYILQPDLMFMK
jgi:hypothetical protein